MTRVVLNVCGIKSKGGITVLNNFLKNNSNLDLYIIYDNLDLETFFKIKINKNNSQIFFFEKSSLKIKNYMSSSNNILANRFLISRENKISVNEKFLDNYKKNQEILKEIYFK